MISSARPAVQPRVDVHPTYDVSYGPVAVELAARAGLILDPWQADALDVMLAVGPDGKYRCFEYGEIVSRQNGKGAVLEARALAGLFLLGEQLIMWSAHEYKTAMEGFRRTLALLRRLGAKVSDNLYDVGGVPVKVINTNGEESLERLDTGQRIKFVARSKGSGRGFSGDVNIIDETFAFTREQQEALLPTMSARPNPQIIYTSSPPLTGDTGPVMFALRRRAEAGGDDSLGWRDWGVDGDLDGLDQVDLDDEDLWAAANPSLGCGRLTIEYVRRERRTMSAEGFARERLGIWPREISSENGAIDLDHWQTLADRESRRAGAVAVAVDITPMRDRAAISVAGLRADGLMHWEVIEDRPDVDWLVGRLVELKAKHDPVAICIDGKGPGASFITALGKAGISTSEQRDEPRRGDLVVTGPQDMADAFGMFVDAARQSQGRHRDQGPLTSALAGAKTRPCGDGGMAWGRKGSANIAPLVAVTLAHWAYETRAHLIVEAGAPNIW
ncbi:terminase [Micromonospora taraxaci]|uniref:terminase n=1 Tax=Micromonospora taraxaci TaxID=1316803 RepID=UPI003C2E80D6